MASEVRYGVKGDGRAFQSLTIGTFARVAAVNVESIRSEQRKGRLPEPAKPYGSVRRYGASHVAPVRFVSPRSGSVSVWTTSGGLRLLDEGTHCNEARKLGEKKLRTCEANPPI